MLVRGQGKRKPLSSKASLCEQAQVGVGLVCSDLELQAGHPGWYLIVGPDMG